MNKEVNEKKKKYAIVITFLVLMICITGGTYAYFALTASNNSVTGSVGGASLNLTVTKVYPTSEHNSKNMIPQLESTLDEAISLEHKCIDGNGNVICQVYSATVTNVGSTSSVLNGTISFTGIENMPNLKWMRINDSNTIGTYSSFNASTDKALFEEERSFGANTSNIYYFVFWIDETGEVQTDNGEFRANIEFDSSTGGLTSTVRPRLNEAEVGSYVTYTGNNNCVGDACSGVSVSGMGYKSDGWRIAYIDEEGSAHLVSAGAPEKICTNSDGTTSNSSCSSYETTNGAPLHIANLNNAALKYCNTKYAKDGVCNNETAWGMRESDFTKITGSSSLKSCLFNSSTDCGLGNELIDIGGFYWFVTTYNSASSANVFFWNSNDRHVNNSISGGKFGVRPVLRLESSVIITGGEGTSERPYTIGIGT